MVVLWKLSNRLGAYCADWENAEVNLAAGLANPRRTYDLATRLQVQFSRDTESLRGPVRADREP